MPKRVEAAVWLETVARLKAENLATVGIVAFKNGDTRQAIRHLEAAAASAAPHQYRLAMLYLETGRKPQALAPLKTIGHSADPALRERAAQAMQKLGMR